MEEALRELQQGFGQELNTLVSANFSELTGGKYDEVHIDRNFDLSVEAEGLHPWP